MKNYYTLLAFILSGFVTGNASVLNSKKHIFDKESISTKKDNFSNVDANAEDDDETLVLYEFTGDVLTPMVSPLGATTSDFQVTGTTPTFNSNQASSWSGSGVPVAQSGSDWGEDNPDDAKYFFFTVDADDGFEMDLSNISFQWRSTGNGPSAITLEINGTVIETFDAPANETTSFSASLAGFEDLENIEVKIKGWDNDSRDTPGTGILRINDVQLNGEINALVPVLTTDVDEISELNYILGNGPSNTQSFDLAGDNLNGSDVNINLAAESNFEISDIEEAMSYENQNLVLDTYNGDLTSIYVRLKDGLPFGNYEENLTISGGGADAITVNLKGRVAQENLVLYEFTGEVLTPMVSPLGATTSDFQVTATTPTFNTNNASTWSGSGVPVAQSGSDWGEDNPTDAKYFFFTINADAGFEMNTSFISFEWRSTGNGPSAITVEVNGTEIETFNAPADETTFYSAELVSFEDLTEIEVRIKGWDNGSRSTSGGGIFRLNDVKLEGENVAVSPVLNTSEIQVSDLNYIAESGPSVPLSFDLSGLSLNGSDVTINLPESSDFEISLNQTTGYDENLILPDYNGDETTIYTRLKEALTEGDYTDLISISGGGADATEVNVNGKVIEKIFLIYNFIGETLEAFQSPPNATTSAFQVSADGLGFGDAQASSWSAGSGVPYANSQTGWGENNAENAKSFFFNISSDIGYLMDVNEISFEWRVTGNGPSVITIEINGTEIESFNAVENTTSVFSAPIISTEKFSEIEIRIKGWDNGSRGTNGDGFFRINDVRLDGEVEEISADYFYQNNAWNSDPVENSTASDDVLVVNGTAEINGELVANNLEVASIATLNVTSSGVLDMAGNIINNGSLVFQSDQNGSGQLAEFSGSIVGNVTVERFIPAGENTNRAFRLISSTVNAGSIYDNWQEGGATPVGYGTHITGSEDGLNGLDATATAAPSLFDFDNSVIDQSDQAAWNPVLNTLDTDLNAGDPYRIFVRGDRNVDLTSNNPTPTNTILRATGTLHTGSFTPISSTVEENFSFIGNPYQAIVDMSLVNYSGVNENYLYVWDANIAENGGYVTVNLPTGSLEPVPNPGSSEANQYLMPGQSAFLRNDGNPGPKSISFLESSKATSQPEVEIFSESSNNTTAYINMRVYKTTKFNAGEIEADALGLRFTENGNNALDNLDAAKLGNPSINLASVNNNKLLAIEHRSIPQSGEEIALFLNSLNTDSYTFTIDMQNFGTDAEVFLKDKYTEELLALEEGINEIEFTADANIPESVSILRFEFVFGNVTLSNDEFDYSEAIQIYPNPSSNGQFSIKTKGLTDGEDIKLNIYNLIGQQVFNKTYQTSKDINGIDTNLDAGIYIIEITQSNTRYTEKLIIK